MKKLLILLMMLMMVLGLAAPALAAGTPTWWVPGNYPKSAPPGYTSWSSGWAEGAVQNLAGSQIIYVSVVIDVPNTYNAENHKLIWSQVEWTPSGSNVSQTFPQTPQISYSNSPCPASAAEPLTDPYGPFFLKDQGTITPDPTHINPNTTLAYETAKEFSFGYNSAPPEADPPGITPQPACERVTFTFQVGVQSQADYRVEVQTVCLTPNAVTLSSLQASRVAANLPAVGLVGIPLITVGLMGGATLIRRTRSTRTRRE